MTLEREAYVDQGILGEFFVKEQTNVGLGNVGFGNHGVHSQLDFGVDLLFEVLAFQLGDAFLQELDVSIKTDRRNMPTLRAPDINSGTDRN